LDDGYWSRKAGMYISSAPWKPLTPSSVRISGPSPHTTKYSKIRDDDPISAAGTGDHSPLGWLGSSAPPGAVPPVSFQRYRLFARRRERSVQAEAEGVMVAGGRRRGLAGRVVV
jgi:hypothetical protein